MPDKTRVPAARLRGVFGAVGGGTYSKSGLHFPFCFSGLGFLTFGSSSCWLPDLLRCLVQSLFDITVAAEQEIRRFLTFWLWIRFLRPQANARLVYKYKARPLGQTFHLDDLTELPEDWN